MEWWIYLLIALFLLFTGFIGALLYHLPRRFPISIRTKHVFITGGSKGIGREIALQALLKGASVVSIAARDRRGLEKAVEELSTHCSSNQVVKCYAMDVTAGYDEVAAVIESAIEASGPIDVLINNAGFVVQGGFDEIPVDSFEKQMKINYLGAVHLTRAVLPHMKKLNGAHIAFVSSAAGQCAIWGYTAYSPSKFAIRGFAEALHMELIPFKIGVSVLYPPNTDTEGFKVEEEEMPMEVKMISNSAGLFSAEYVAKALVSNIEEGEFTTTIGFEGSMLGALTAGAAPEPNIMKALVQVLFGGIFRAVMIFVTKGFHDIVQSCHVKKTVTSSSSEPKRD